MGLLIGLSHIRHYIPDGIIKTLVMALVMSRIQYCLTVYGNGTKKNFQRIQKILNFAARVIFGRRKFDHVSDLRDQLGWMTPQTMGRLPDRSHSPKGYPAGRARGTGVSVHFELWHKAQIHSPGQPISPSPTPTWNRQASFWLSCSSATKQSSQRVGAATARQICPSRKSAFQTEIMRPYVWVDSLQSTLVRVYIYITECGKNCVCCDSLYVCRVDCVNVNLFPHVANLAQTLSGNRHAVCGWLKNVNTYIHTYIHLRITYAILTTTELRATRTSRGDWPTSGRGAQGAELRRGRSTTAGRQLIMCRRHASLYHLAEFSGRNLALRVNDKCPKFSFFLKRPY